MSLASRFTEDEIFLLTTTPTQIGTVMAFSEGSGLGTVKEMFASSKSYVNGLKEYPNNEIITGVLPSVTDLKEAMGKSKEMRTKAVDRLKELGISSADQLRGQLIEDSKAVAAILDEKATPEEASEYKEWAMGIARNVAHAAKEGGFLGFGGTRVSDGEKEAFTKIAEALGTSDSIV
ncbi:MAG: hypothetical protein V3V19_09065 [Cocleimonas sp.]